jgi:two-component system, NtrC family, sensor kinase
LPKIEVNPDEMAQVFANVIKNAIQAMKGKGTLHITTVAANGWITVRINDTGPGIRRDLVTRIFDPFFTVKAPGQGAGLGLTVVHRIVTKYGGQVQVETEEGYGTTFILMFPASKSGFLVKGESTR